MRDQILAETIQIPTRDGFVIDVRLYTRIFREEESHIYGFNNNREQNFWVIKGKIYKLTKLKLLMIH